MAVKLRSLLPDSIVTIAPIVSWGDVVPQVKAIHEEARKEDLTWRDILSWINAQFYAYPKPDPDPFNAYNKLLAQDMGPMCPKLTAYRLVLGVPLKKKDKGGETFNPQERDTTSDAASRLRKEWVDFAGVFVWRWMETRIPVDLNWAAAMEKALGRWPG